MSDPLDKLYKKSFLEGQEMEAQKAAAAHFGVKMEATKHAVEVAAEIIDLADQLASDGNPHKRRLAEVIKASVIGGAQQLTSPGQGDGGTSPEALPFSGVSPNSETTSPDSTKALPHEPSSAPKRGRGRPRKNSHKPT